MLRPFTLHQPASAEDASAILAEHGEEARLYAGGTELLLVMKQGLLAPGHLVDIKRIPGISQITLDEASGTLSIGAAATHRQIERDPLILDRFPVLSELEGQIANVRVRATGTLGGNLCFGEPHADPGPLLLVYDAQTRLERAGEARTLPLDEFFVGPFETVLEPDELLTRVEVPPLPARSGAAYQRFVTLEWPSVGVAASVTLSEDGGTVAEGRIGIGCVGPRPIRARDAEAQLARRPLDEVLADLDAIGAAAAAEADVSEDRAGPEEYKRHLVAVLTRRALRQACARATEGLAS